MKLPPYEQIVIDFKRYFYEFSQDAEMYPDVLIEKALTRTKRYFGNRWGEYKYNSNLMQGWFNYAAHTIFKTKQQIKSALEGEEEGSIRGIDSTTIKSESVTFGSQIMLKLQPWEEELSSSSYGNEYLHLRSLVMPMGFVC